MSGQADTPEPRRNHERLATRLAEGALELYGLRGARLDLLSGGFAQVYRVQTEPGERFVLRLYGLPRADEAALRADPRLRTGPGRRSPDTLRSQVSWLSALRRETGLLVPEPIPTLEGALVGRVSVERAQTGRHCSLARWVPGTHKSRDLSPADLELVGSFVARMHAHAERYPLPEPSALPRWDWSWPFGESAPLWEHGRAFYSEEEMGVFAAASRGVRGDLERLGEGRDVFGVVHRDLNLDNVVFCEGRVGVVDFDACGLGHYLLDLFRVRRAITTRHGDRLKPLWAAFLRGYEGTRPLARDPQGYLRTFATMQTVAAVNAHITALVASGGQRKRERDPRFLTNAVGLVRRMSAR